MQSNRAEPRRATRQPRLPPAGIILAAACALSGGWAFLPRLAASDAATAPPAAATGTAADRSVADRSAASKPEFRSERIRGRMAWLADALDEHFGVSSVPEVRQHALVLVTEAGELIPIVEDARGRAFRKDDRLRQMDLELLVRRYDRHPYVQILQVFEIEGQQRFEIDYWCDVCAIVMYESGPCSCCQADNQLRRRKVHTP